MKMISHSIKTHKENRESKVVEKPQKRVTEESKEGNTIPYYKEEYKERYLNYQKSNPDLSQKQIIKNVNMQLDKEFYEDPLPAEYLNTEKVLVNKHYYLENDYVPEKLENISVQYALSDMKLVHEAREAFETLAKAAKKQKLNIVAMSTYRSYDYQVKLWNKYAKQDGERKADTYSGRAGHSEHQTGLAVDVYNEKENYTNFEKTKEFDWMQEHAHEYGFILRFPKDKENETGYQYESWHYRYVGVEAATYIKEKNISFEEYYATIIEIEKNS
jgi:D-alanyl-D-alanine carboxypeptidase